MGSYEPPDFERGPAGIGGPRGRSPRRQAPERRMRSPHPRLAGNGATATRWRPGREGAQAVSEAISARCGDRALALHDRGVGTHRDGIDHLVVARSGIWVVDSELARGRVELGQDAFGSTTVLIDGRDRTDLVDALRRQVALVSTVMNAIEPAVQVRGVLCLVTPKGIVQEAGLPALRPLAVGEVPLMTPQRLTQHLLDEGFLSPMNRTRISRALAQRFPAQAGAPLTPSPRGAARRPRAALRAAVP